MRHHTALIWATLTGITLAAATAAGPALADVPGFALKVTSPATAKAGGAAPKVTAVVTSNQAGCRKVRWTMVIRGGDVSLDQIRVTRIENGGEFATRVSVTGNTATIVDQQPDPGILCRDRTVTGTWQLAFGGRDGGRVQFEVQAFDERNTRLTAAGSAIEVAGPVATTTPAPRPPQTSASPATSPTGDDGVSEVVTTAPIVQPTRSDNAAALSPAANQSNLLGPGLIVGGVFFFLGLLLILRLRARTRKARGRDEALPTGFYTMP
ncbi:hypothetical protein ACWT_5213 [Actinoplanes sp. SE50]|uniref:hypothetical protein n=1 Tax=unclassified Actinoplanes TaxID=2626549 RepID=UPI00023EBBEF|nr:MULTISPECIES: hypothetical protein [unclassified Actinoplanes]AEV86230.1 hypothetical protein ACPL_5343 [Actinoplanes sp. SE50/110]ATO84628.1 hypothetical protein ACWT_5213 [Actinoplanes sp. SE50]SLM02038.1 uncharacterized protein ACSP50_5276 [Actinoplanes sp. SE50/110]